MRAVCGKIQEKKSCCVLEKSEADRGEGFDRDTMTLDGGARKKKTEMCVWCVVERGESARGRMRERRGKRRKRGGGWEVGGRWQQNVAYSEGRITWEGSGPIGASYGTY